MTSRSDLAAEAIAGACAAVAVALVLDRSQVVKKAAARVPRLGWNTEDPDEPPLLARLLGTLVATIVFRSTFSVTRGAAKKAIDAGAFASTAQRVRSRVQALRPGADRSPSDAAPALV